MRISGLIALVALEVALIVALTTFHIESRATASAYGKWLKNPSPETKRLWESAASKDQRINNIVGTAIGVALLANTLAVLWWPQNREDAEE